MKLTGQPKSKNVRDMRKQTGVATARATIRGRAAAPTVDRIEQMVDQDITHYVQDEMRPPKGTYKKTIDETQALVKRLGDTRKGWGWNN